MNTTVNILNTLISTQSDSADKIKNIADFICNVFATHNITYQRIKHKHNDAESIIAGINTKTLSNINSGLVLSGHIDTVSANAELWSCNPYHLNVRNNKIIGRGAVDMKYFIAVILSMIPELQKQNYPILLIFTGDEETDVSGIQCVCDFMKKNNIKPDFAIVGEPTNFQLCTSHNGYNGYTTTVYGKSVHSSQILDGINSIYIATKIITHIQKLASKYFKYGTTINVGKILGGNQRNTVPGRTSFDWEIRTKKDFHQSRIIKSVNKVQNKLVKKNTNIKIETTDAEQICTFTPNPDSKITKIIKQITNADTIKMPIATEAGFLQQHGIDTVIFGAGQITQAHTTDEEISMDEIFNYKKILEQILKHLN